MNKESEDNVSVTSQSPRSSICSTQVPHLYINSHTLSSVVLNIPIYKVLPFLVIGMGMVYLAS